MRVRLRIAEISEKRGWNQRTLSEMSGVSPQLIHRYWNNYTKSVSLQHIVMIATALQVDVDDLLVVEAIKVA